MSVGRCGYNEPAAVGSVVRARTVPSSELFTAAAAGVAEGYQVFDGVFAAVSDGFEVEGLNGAFAFARCSPVTTVAAGEVVTLVYLTADFRGGSKDDPAVWPNYTFR